MGDSEDLRKDLEAIARIDAVPRILEVVSRTTGMGFVAVARVTDKRWICCRALDRINFGLEAGGELGIETTICDEIREHGRPVVISHVSENLDFCGHPTPAQYGFQSYVSFPIWRRNGEFFGTLCAIDPKPASVDTPEVRSMFRLFGDLISFHLEAQERLDVTEAALLDARQAAVLREQFIAVLGHDLRNPLNALGMGAGLLRTVPSDEAQSILERMDRSIARMTELIGNLTDFARGRLGGGLLLNPSTERAQLDARLHDVVEELQSAWPGRRIDTHIELTRDISVDVARISQLLSNLLANALTHGAAGRPVLVTATTSNDAFELVVFNEGPPIPDDVKRRLFQPFTRGTRDGEQKGLGLGLYIVAEIAAAHGGRVDVTSDEGGTRFAFTAPLR